jgi:hypothetical protein
MPVPVVNLDAVLGRVDANMVMELEINGLTITDHPLFIDEDYLACDLLALYRKYKQRAEVGYDYFFTSISMMMSNFLPNLLSDPISIFSLNLFEYLQADWVGFCTRKLEALYAALENCRIEQDLVSGTTLLSPELGGIKETGAVQSIKEEIRRLRLQRAQVGLGNDWKCEGRLLLG